MWRMLRRYSKNEIGQYKLPSENGSTTNNGSQTSDTQTKKYDKEVYATIPDLQK